MPWPVRTIEPHEYREFMRVCDISFGDPDITDDDFDDCKVIGETDRSHVALDGDAFVGTAGAYSFDLTVPGGAMLPMAGVTDVGVLPTHRRRGVLSSLMAFQLDAVAERGDPFAGLTASEAGIYRRFGYGIATRRLGVEIDTPRSAFRHEPACGGRLRMPDAKEPWSQLAPVWDAHRPAWAGALSRSAAWWELYQRDRERWRQGASRMFRIVHESDAGTVDGYVLYRLKEGWDAGGPHGSLLIDELIAIDPEVEAALWRACLDVDLTTKLITHDLREDHPLRHRLGDQRAMKTVALRDHLWLRFLDVPRCLEARSYGADGSLTVKIVDVFRRASGGTFRLTVDGGGATCEPSRGRPDLVLDTADLASTYLGGTPFRTLAEAGLVEERTAGSIARADALFATSRAPWCAQGF